jgi:hypothetical protein
MKKYVHHVVFVDESSADYTSATADPLRDVDQGLCKFISFDTEEYGTVRINPDQVCMIATSEVVDEVS